MGSEEASMIVKGPSKDMKEKKFFKSDEYTEYSEKTKTSEHIVEFQSLQNEIITGMTVFHSEMKVPSVTQRVVHVYCFLFNRKLIKKNKVILIEYGPYNGLSEHHKETPHYPCGNGYRFFLIDGYFNNEYDGFAIVHNEMAFKKILEHLKYGNWTARDYKLFSHNCQNFLMELISLLKAELIPETIPLRTPYSVGSLYVNGVFEIPYPVLCAFINVIDKMGNLQNFLEKNDININYMGYNLERYILNHKKGFKCIVIYDSESRSGASECFKIYYKDFINFYKYNKQINRLNMASFCEFFYLLFQDKLSNNNKYKHYKINY